MHEARKTSNLNDLRPGDSARIVGYNGMQPASIRRFMALGLIPGHEVQCIRRATFGCPVEFEVMGTRIAVRAEDARHIGVFESYSSNS